MAATLAVGNKAELGADVFNGGGTLTTGGYNRIAKFGTGTGDTSWANPNVNGDFNTAGVGMSATESIFSSDKALEADPLVPDGVAENSVFNIVLPYIRSAREGVSRLGELIEKHGIAEGFGIGFVDSREIWYLETASGHRWLAFRMPEDRYFVTGNQSRFREYEPDDKDNFLASADLINFAAAHQLCSRRKGGRYRRQK